MIMHLLQLPIEQTAPIFEEVFLHENYKSLQPDILRYLNHHMKNPPLEINMFPTYVAFVRNLKLS